MPSNSAESNNIRDALQPAFERVDKNARIVAECSQLEYALLRNSEFLPEGLKNLTLV